MNRARKVSRLKLTLVTAWMCIGTECHAGSILVRLTDDRMEASQVDVEYVNNDQLYIKNSWLMDVKLMYVDLEKGVYHA
jgi:hypothetical protein